jgi:membrane protease YdiL (CAAX protease family)
MVHQDAASRRGSSITLIGLALSLLGYFIVSILIDLPPVETTLPFSTRALIGFAGAWLLAGLTLLLVTKGEQRPLASIGLSTPSWKDILLGVGVGVGLSLTVPLLTLLVTQVIPAADEGSIAAVTQSVSPALLLLSVLTAGITEEVLYRAYPIERLLEITSKGWIAVLIPLIAFVLPHLLSWNTAHVVGVVIPLGLALTGLYVWKRSLIVNMIAHTLIDLPLVFIALGSTL